LKRINSGAETQKGGKKRIKGRDGTSLGGPIHWGGIALKGGLRGMSSKWGTVKREGGDNIRGGAASLRDGSDFRKKEAEERISEAKARSSTFNPRGELIKKVTSRWFTRFGRKCRSAHMAGEGGKRNLKECLFRR